MASFLERAAHSVDHIFSLLCLFVPLVVLHFGFDGGTLILIALVPGNCLPFTFCMLLIISVCKNTVDHLQALQ